jgi:hypothetical protein
MSDEPALRLDEVPDDRTLPLLHQVVYCSRVADGVDDDAVARIVDAARRNNPAHGITGLLVFGGGVFFQWIEGPRAQIVGLMAIIREDTRHRDVVMLSETEEVRERLFPEWDMELVGPEDIREVLEDALDTAKDPGSVTALTRLLGKLDDGPLDSLGDGA